MNKWSASLFLGGVTVLGIAGCGDGNKSPSASQAPRETKYVVMTEPAGSIPVGEARDVVKDAEEVVLVGRIGGSTEPFVDGIAAFTIVDPKVPSCAGEEGCPTPWDYCCTQNEVKDNIATVKIVDDQGQPLPRDARELLGVKELNLVVVHGKAQRDAAGNLALLADRVFVKE
jgi:hypothetical protein